MELLLYSMKREVIGANTLYAELGRSLNKYYNMNKLYSSISHCSQMECYA